MAISTLDPDDRIRCIGTTGIDPGPTDTAHQVYKPVCSPVNHSTTVGLGQRRKEEVAGHIEQPESPSFAEEVQKKQPRRS